MNPQAWIALAGLAFFMLAQAGGFLWWAATISAKVGQLQISDTRHGDLRDIVIEMRSEMKGFQSSIRELAESVRETRGPARRSRSGEGG